MYLSLLPTWPMPWALGCPQAWKDRKEHLHRFIPCPSKYLKRQEAVWMPHSPTQCSQGPGSGLHQARLRTQNSSIFLKFLPSKTKQTTKLTTQKKRPNISTPRLQIEARGKTGSSQQTLVTLAQGLKHLQCHWKGWGGDRNSLLQWEMTSCYINTEKNRTLQITDDVALAILPPAFNSLKYCYWHLLVTRENKQTRA